MDSVTCSQLSFDVPAHSSRCRRNRAGLETGHRTELFGKNPHVATGSAASGSPYRAYFEKLEELTDREAQNAVLEPADVAEVVLKIMEAKRPRMRYIVGNCPRFLLNLRCYLPGEIFDDFWTREMTRRLGRRR